MKNIQILAVPRNMNPPKNWVDDINELLSRLYGDFAVPYEDITLAYLHKMIRQPNKVFVLALDTTSHPHRIVGMGSIFFLHTTHGKTAFVEDIAVRRDYRRRGIGTAIVKKIISCAQKHKALYADLTSQKKRRAARRIYRRFGFEDYNTTLFSLDLSPKINRP